MSSVSIRDLSLSFGSAQVLKDLNLEIAEGEFLVLLGSSGCGKSTLLNCIAGLLEVSAGQIHISGRNVTWEEPSDRGIGMVFQSYALYPQMTVERNLSFGLRNQRMPKDEIKKRVDRAAQILQIEPLLHRKPAALSGGQRQRVAIGRAMVREADVFLFDEPLSNLDAKLRTDLRVELKSLHQRLGNTMIYVTHDQVEAMTLADRIAIMREGKIQQLDDPETIYTKPANKYVADFIGSPAMNFFEGSIEGDQFKAADFAMPLSDYAFAAGGAKDGKAWLGVRPEHILTGKDAKKATVILEAVIDIVEPMGSDTLVWVKLGEQAIRVRTGGQSGLKAGDPLTLGLQGKRASLFDFASEERL